jgi:hypothetical protein
LTKQSIPLGSNFYYRCLDGCLNLRGFGVMAFGLCTKTIGGCPIAYLARHRRCIEPTGSIDLSAATRS